MLESSENQLRFIVGRRLGDSAEARAYANSLIGAAEQYYRNKATDEGAPDRKIQRDRMKRLAKLLRQLEKHTATFSWHDWRNLSSGAYRANQSGSEPALPLQGLDELSRTWPPALAKAAESADWMLARPGRPLDGGLWVFLYWALHDYTVFFQEPPDVSETSNLVALISEALPYVEPAWADRKDIQSTIKNVAQHLRD